MANKSYLYPEDEFNDEDHQPYDKLSDRDTLVDVMPATTPSISDGVKAAILSKMSGKQSVPISSRDDSEGDSEEVSDDSNDLHSDPMMKDYLASQSKLDDFRRAKMESDYISNLGSAFSQIAQGVNTPKPNTEFYSQLNKQDAGYLKSNEEDVDRRNKVMSAIEQRKSREGIAADNLDMREMLMKQHSLDADSRNSERSAAKNEAQINKWTTQMKDDLDPNKARGGNLASNQKRVDNAQRIETLLAQVHNNPDPRQMEELAIASQALLSASGTPAAEQVKALIPHTAMGSANAFREWLTNDPTGTGQQEFVKRMAETVQREKAVASGQVQSAQRARLSAYGKFKSADPDTYNSILNSYGLGDEKQGVSALDEKNMSAAIPVQLQAPDGSIRLVPADKVDAAIAAGGKRL